MKRESFLSTPEEYKEYRHLKDEEGVAFEFWGRVALSRGLDYQTIIFEDETVGYFRFTALPLGHNKDWCWPMPLKCITDPSLVEY
jgi:hypothetical protein